MTRATPTAIGYQSGLTERKWAFANSGVRVAGTGSGGELHSGRKNGLAGRDVLVKKKAALPIQLETTLPDEV